MSRKTGCCSFFACLREKSTFCRHRCTLFFVSSFLLSLFSSFIAVFAFFLFLSSAVVFCFLFFQIRRALMDPSHIVVVFDSCSSRDSRLAIFEGYKGNRSEAPPGLQQQFRAIRRLCHSLGRDSLHDTFQTPLPLSLSTDLPLCVREISFSVSLSVLTSLSLLFSLCFSSPSSSALFLALCRSLAIYLSIYIVVSSLSVFITSALSVFVCGIVGQLSVCLPPVCLRV